MRNPGEAPEPAPWKGSGSLSRLDIMGSPHRGQLVDQRIRNRLREYLVGVLEYRDRPGVWDLNEVLNLWEDYVRQPFATSDFRSPTYTPDEVASLSHTNGAWVTLCAATPKTIRDEQSVFAMEEWHTFVEACQEALSVLERRGPLPEDKKAT